MRTKLPQLAERKDKSKDVYKNDEQAKEKMNHYADFKNKARESLVKEGDRVLVKALKENKLSTPFNTTPYIVTQKHGTQITAEREGCMITRNSSHFKKVDIKPNILKNSEEREEELEEIEISNTPTPCQQNLEIQSPTVPNSPLSSVHKRPSRSVKMPEYLKNYVLS